MAGIDKLDKNELAADFGSSYGVGLILAHPELMLLAYKSQGWTNARIDKKTGKIIKGKNTGEEWNAETVAGQIQQTDWYKERDGNQRAAENAELSDSAGFDKRVQNLIDQIQHEATQAGANLDGVDVAADARQMLRDNWLYMSGQADASIPERLLNAYLAPHLLRNDQGNFSGEAATTVESLRQKADSYGVTFSQDWFDKGVRQLKAGEITEADLDNEIIAASKSQYAGVGDMISPSRSLKDIADPYMQQLAQTLEIPYSQITLMNPDIQRALQVTDPETGKTRSMSLYEFKMDLRQKPQWLSTTEGKREMRTGAMNMLKDFGFVK